MLWGVQNQEAAQAVDGSRSTGVVSSLQKQDFLNSSSRCIFHAPVQFAAPSAMGLDRAQQWLSAPRPAQPQTQQSHGQPGIGMWTPRDTAAATSTEGEDEREWGEKNFWSGRRLRRRVGCGSRPVALLANALPPSAELAVFG